MREYAAGLKALEGLNFRINTIGCVRAIMASSTIEKLVSVGEYN